MGLQDYYYVSASSQSSALAMTWDKTAFYAQAKAVATEFDLKGIQLSMVRLLSHWDGLHGVDVWLRLLALIHI